MGTVATGRKIMKRFVLLLAVLALAAPALSRADGGTYTAPYAMGPQGGDQFNRIEADPATGEMSILRYSVNAPFSGGLGCGGQGGFVFFAVSHDATDPVTSVTVSYTDALVGPYAFVNVGVRQGDGFLDGEVQRGIITEAGSVTVDLPQPAIGALTVWFGLQVSSACPPAPPVEGAMLTFTSVVFA